MNTFTAVNEVENQIVRKTTIRDHKDEDSSILDESFELVAIND